MIVNDHDGHFCVIFMAVKSNLVFIDVLIKWYKKTIVDLVLTSDACHLLLY